MEETLRDWVQRWGEKGPSTFADEHGTPFLLRLSRVERPASGPGSEKHKRFMTMAIGKSMQTRADPLDLPVYPVTKGEGNVFGMMITIGRAANNDIVIDASSISKFHAYLEERDGEWHVRDANSSNGTFIGGEQVPSDASRPLVDATEVLFARVACRFMLPATFQELLKKEAARLAKKDG